MPGYSYYYQKPSGSYEGSSFSETIAGMIIGAFGIAACGVVIGIVVFTGMAAFTCVASVIVPSVVKISTWAMAASELANCVFLSMESLFVGAAFGFIKNKLQRKSNYSSLKNNKSRISSIACNASMGMAVGFFFGVSGAKGIIQSAFLNASINPQSIIGAVISSGGAGGLAGSGGLSLFFLLLLIFIIQGIIIGLIVGAILGSFSGLLTSAVRSGLIETNIFLFANSDDKTEKNFLQHLLEGIAIGCLLGLLHGAITGTKAVANYKSITNPDVKTENPVYQQGKPIKGEINSNAQENEEIKQRTRETIAEIRPLKNIDWESFQKKAIAPVPLLGATHEMTADDVLRMEKTLEKIFAAPHSETAEIEPVLQMETAQKEEADLTIHPTLKREMPLEYTLAPRPAQKIFTEPDFIKKPNEELILSQLYNDKLLGTESLKDIDNRYFDKYLKPEKELSKGLQNIEIYSYKKSMKNIQKIEYSSLSKYTKEKTIEQVLTPENNNEADFEAIPMD